MASRTSMLISDVQLTKVLEASVRAKERFKLIHDLQSFEATP